MSPILTPHTLDFNTHSPAQTRRVAARLAGLLRSGDLICLEGELGTGKTCFVQGLGEGLDATAPIRSPSFTLIGEYPTPPPLPPLYHVDLYRIEAVEEALAIGLEEYLYGEGICAIEWADRVPEVIPAHALQVHVEHAGPTTRRIRVSLADQRRRRELAKRLQRCSRERPAGR